MLAFDVHVSRRCDLLAVALEMRPPLLSALLVDALVLATSVGIAEVRALSADALRAACPSERASCHERVARGECYGKTLRAQTLARSCACSCNRALHARIQNCCKTVGDTESKHCMPLCRYNTTVEEASGELSATLLKVAALRAVASDTCGH